MDPSVFRLITFSASQILKSDDEEDLVASLKTISSKTVWVILMTGGGHFAGAVFKGSVVASFHI